MIYDSMVRYFKTRIINMTYMYLAVTFEKCICAHGKTQDVNECGIYAQDVVTMLRRQTSRLLTVRVLATLMYIRHIPIALQKLDSGVPSSQSTLTTKRYVQLFISISEI
jgi:hypothetical protein